jgi:ATP-dependent DNA ligase
MIDAPYAPGNGGLWRKAKWLNRQEFVVAGWSDPEGSRPHGVGPAGRTGIKLLI